jgi:hypothetical protein
MNTGTPVEELMAQLDMNLPIETTSAQLKADAMWAVCTQFII